MYMLQCAYITFMSFMLAGLTWPCARRAAMALHGLAGAYVRRLRIRMRSLCATGRRRRQSGCKKQSAWLQQDTIDKWPIVCAWHGLADRCCRRRQRIWHGWQSQRTTTAPYFCYFFFLGFSKRVVYVCVVVGRVKREIGG